MSFGAPSSAPPFGSTPAPSFGTPTFGAANTPSFGATNTPSFGATNTPSFGATNAPSFGATNAPQFGATNAPSFGATGAPPFGATSAPSFGGAAAPAFGGSSASTFGPANPTPLFGATTSAAPSFGLNFGATSTSSGLNFGTPSLGGAPSFNLGSTAAASSAPTLGFSFGSNTTTVASNTFNLAGNTPSLFGKPATTQSSDLSKPASVGLGGADTTGGSLLGGITAGNTSIAGTNQTNPTPKSITLPVELATTVDAFKANVQQCKQTSSDISRYSIRPLHKVQNDSDSYLRDITELLAELSARRRTANNLRSRAANALPAAERANRIAETPHGLEYDSGEMVSWITDVVAEGESRLILLRRQLEAAQHQLDASHKLITDEELALGMRRIHESFIAVAGRLQAVHQQVESQKTQYLSLRRNILKDPTDVFIKSKNTLGIKEVNDDWFSRSTGKLNTILENSSSAAVVADPLTALGFSQSNRQGSSTGPNPFSHLGTSGFGGLPFGFNKSQTNASPGNTSWGVSSLQSSPAGSQLPFSTFGGLHGSDQSPFNLQKPPAGNKRGKY